MLAFAPVSAAPISALIAVAATPSTVVSGYTRTATGTALPGCTVKLFRTSDDVKVATTTSDGTGLYTFTDPGAGPFYALAYLDGSPDVTGVTLNNLVPF
jgi:hypothetical protein